MKKLILGLALMLTFAFTKAQTVDSVYKSSTYQKVPDLNKPTEKLDPVKLNSEFIFRVDPVRMIFKIDKDSLVFIVQDVVSHQDEGKDCYIGYYGTIKDKPVVLTTKRTKGVLVSIGLSEGTTGQIFYINQANDISDDVRTRGRVGRNNTTRSGSSSDNNDTKLPR